jgi:hypothetical protein
MMVQFSTRKPAAFKFLPLRPPPYPTGRILSYDLEVGGRPVFRGIKLVKDNTCCLSKNVK